MLQMSAGRWPWAKISTAKREIYETVRLAQETAAKAARPGMTAGELDQVARGVIAEASYGQYFTHRLGHGIGMQVHEPVNLEPGSKQKLEAGMCFSIEPGIICRVFAASESRTAAGWVKMASTLLPRPGKICCFCEETVKK
ncbi:hypothetical protein NRIC0767_00620 [Lactobacillus delbrueckii subsp. allosunkii]|nr:hypothetical protein NRIC0766_08810 [Lactobacillus delbrueckii subsp. sunkii]GHN13801.1 hypothetical protein NRIC0767_00620 [Lactobacillus delbrueckii subsp. sunkii]